MLQDIHEKCSKNCNPHRDMHIYNYVFVSLRDSLEEMVLKSRKMNCVYEIQLQDSFLLLSLQQDSLVATNWDSNDRMEKLQTTRSPS